MPTGAVRKAILFANTDWYLYNFRLPLARALRARGVEVVLVSPPGDYGRRLEEEGFRWLAVPMSRRGLHPLHELAALARLAGIYRRERPDLAHHFTVKSVVYGTIAAYAAGVSSVVNAVAGLGYVFASASRKARLLRPLVAWLLRAVLRRRRSLLIVQNPDDGRELVARGIVTPERIRLIRGSGVDTLRFAPAPSHPVIGPIRIVMATRLLWDKGVQQFVDAARMLKCEGLALQFVLAGAIDDGNPAAIPRSQVEAWRAEGIISVPGHVVDMRSLLRESDIVVLPTYYGEGVPRILLEAAACGIPLVATDVPGCREIVNNGVNGLLVPPRDPQALARAIRTLSIDGEYRHRLGAAGRAIAEAEFDETRVIEATLHVYDELLDTPGTAVTATPVRVND